MKSFKRKFLKANKGITLVALVVTIIVLLILAGVAITTLTNDNGIIQRAIKTKDNLNLAGIKEEVRLVISSREINEKSKLTNKTLKEDLENDLEGQKTITEVNELKDVCYATRDGIELTVYEDGEIYEGKVSVWDGSTVECPEFRKENNVFNWNIYTAGQLKFLADFVNNGNTLTSEQQTLVTNAGYQIEDVSMTTETIISLKNNIDLGAREEGGSWETTANESKKWTPIGKVRANVEGILGKVEGNNYTIRGMYVNEGNAGQNGLFGCANSINELNIMNCFVKGGQVTGGLVGRVVSGTIENCKLSCVEVKGTGNFMGGIVGSFSIGDGIKNCTMEKGSVEGVNCVAGIVGAIFPSNGIVENCHNKSIVVATGFSVGGIVGQAANSIIKDSSNSARVSTSGYNESNKTSMCGGVVGGCYYASVSNCWNTGDVYAVGKEVGGISGMQGYGTVSTMLENCYNTGRIESSNYGLVGGISGYLTGNSTIKYTHNLGTIQKNSVVSEGAGGIAGEVVKTCLVTNSYNKGAIIGSQNVGAIIGKNSSSKTSSNCYYLNSLNLKAVNGADDEDNNMIGIPNNFNSLKEFLNWLEEQ